MIRVKRGNIARQRRNRIFKLTKGYKGSNSKLSVMCSEQLRQSMYFAYIGRRLKKRVLRSLWISRINIASRARNINYSNFIGNLRKLFILLDRKILAILAFNDLACFNFIEDYSKKNSNKTLYLINKKKIMNNKNLEFNYSFNYENIKTEEQEILNTNNDFEIEIEDNFDIENNVNNDLNFQINEEEFTQTLFNSSILDTQNHNLFEFSKNNTLLEIVDETNLKKYGTNLTDLAKNGKLNETFGREKEFENMLTILARRQKNNPVLLGQPGVGKTAIVELFAIKLIKNLVPFIFTNKELISLDLVKLVGGANFRGEFEKRFTKLLDEIFKAGNIILFIDEIHQITSNNVNGGNSGGIEQIGNILKPVLSRSGFQCIGASTPKEYEIIIQDGPLNRRFQSIIVEEPTITETIDILYSIRSNLETYHNVEILPNAIKASVELSARYIYDRFLPDKAIDLIDRVASKIVIEVTSNNNQTVLEALIHTYLLKISKLKLEAFRRGDISTEFVLQEIENAYRHLFLKWINNPQKIPFSSSQYQKIAKANVLSHTYLSSEFFKLIQLNLLERVDELLFVSNTLNKKNISNLTELQINLLKEILINFNPILQKTLLQSFFETGELKFTVKEKSTIFNLLGFYGTSDGKIFLNEVTFPELSVPLQEIKSSFNLKRRIHPKDIESMITDITGIPINSLTNEETTKLLNLEKNFKKSIIGQEDAINAISRVIKRSRLGFQDPKRPLASFLFCGPTGVGKTEITKALALTLFGSETDMIRFDMSEFMEKFNVTRLIGSPPGYIGYQEGGELTSQVSRKPYSVVLFDEIEKAHPDILTILLQILEDGRLTDSQKRLVKFTNTIIILTSNVGATEIQEIVKQNTDILHNESIQQNELNNKELLLKDEYVTILEFLESPIKKTYLQDIHEYLKNQFEKSIKKLKNYEIIKKEIKNNSFIKKPDVLKERLKTAVLNSLKNIFLPEFLNRLDDIIIFQPLKLEEIIKVCDIMIEQIILRFKKKNINLFITRAVRLKLGKEGYNPAFGARPLRRLLTKNIEDLVTDFILQFGTIIEVITISINLNHKNEIIIE